MDYFLKKAMDTATALDIGYDAADLDIIALALKEVARDQRHACAEAVNDLDGSPAIGSPNLVTVGRAHAACMNANLP